VQPFLPHSLATQGPKLAVGDVNGDGLEDVYVCGAADQPGGLFLQKENELFQKAMQPAFAQDSAYEDADALFFDTDNDRDLDLYVCSGGNRWYGRNALLNDRLYKNDGRGNFSRSGTLPDLYENKSCVRACDYDRDGDLDLFVGGRANARIYGYMPASVLLQNDGHGAFAEVTERLSEGLINAGMVTDACWSDVDKDGWVDLVVVGEWMPLTIYKNENGYLKKLAVPELENTEGWWTCIYKTDLDSDGMDDFLLGNWGTNTKLKASTRHPLQLYVRDWDSNGETDPVLAVHNGSDYYTFLGKNDLERRLPFLKKRFLKYSDMAGKTVSDVFTPAALQQARVLKSCHLASSVLWHKKNKWRLEALPNYLQAAPLFSFTTVAMPLGNAFVAAGNFYDVLPYEGRYDAQLPVVFRFFKTACRFQSFLLEKGAVRDLKTIRLGKKQALLVAKNNDTLTILKQK
jgi:hypothetical protein